MQSELLTNAIWRDLTIMASKHRGVVAVPYLASGGAKLLPLREGSVLVVSCTEACVRSGLVDPSELLRLANRGVQIHNCTNLHAKVYVFGRSAVVGSANVSTSSAMRLFEAGIRTSDPTVVQACRAFVLSLCGDQLSTEYLTELKKVYRPPIGVPRPLRNGSKQLLPQHSLIWAVPLAPTKYDPEDKANMSKARAAARSVADLAAQSLDEFVWSGKQFVDKLSFGQRVVMCTEARRGSVLVSPPARILAVNKYQVGRSHRAAVVLGLPKFKRARRAKSIAAKLGSAAEALGKLRGPLLLRDAKFVVSLGQLWGSES